MCLDGEFAGGIEILIICGIFWDQFIYISVILHHLSSQHRCGSQTNIISDDIGAWDDAFTIVVRLY
jgi:hypothetical protein